MFYLLLISGSFKADFCSSYFLLEVSSISGICVQLQSSTMPISGTPTKCDVCETISPSVKLCSACLGAAYCGRNCQVSARSRHKACCTAIKEKMAEVEKEKTALLKKWGEDTWKARVGFFWDHAEARPYLTARHYLGWLYNCMGHKSHSKNAFGAADKVCFE